MSEQQKVSYFSSEKYYEHVRMFDLVVNFPTDCIYGFTNPTYPSFVLPPSQPNSPGDVQLNHNNPIRLANGSNLAAGQGCNSRGFSYYEHSLGKFLNTYIDAEEHNSSIVDVFYATNHDQLNVRTIQTHQANLGLLSFSTMLLGLIVSFAFEIASFLTDRILKIDLDCNNGLLGCAYFTVGNGSYNSTESKYKLLFGLPDCLLLHCSTTSQCIIDSAT